MKIIPLNSLIILLCLYSINGACIPGKNCPKGQGICQKNKCICINYFWTLKNNQSKGPMVFCNYERLNRYKLLIFEFLIPSLGHFLAGKYYIASVKLSLLFIPILSCITGFCFYYKSDSYQNSRGKKNDINNEEEQPLEINRQNSINSGNSGNLHEANREEKPTEWFTYLPVIVTFICLTILIIIHLIDMICYGFAYYYDGNGVPLI